MPLNFIKQVLDRLAGGAKVETLTWCLPQIVDRGKVSGASLALDHNGRGLMLWENQGELRLMSLRPSDGVAIANFPVGPGGAPLVVTSDKGLGIALWIETDESSTRILGSPFTVTSPNLLPVTIYRGEGQVQYLQAAIDRRGSALVVWCVERSGSWEVLAQSYDARKAAWEESPVRLGGSLEHALVPRLAMNWRGRAMVAWEVQEASFEGFVVSHYWTSERIWSDSPVPGVAHLGHELEITMDGHGDALAVWVARPHGQQVRLESSRYRTADSVWEETQVLATGLSLDHLRLRGTEDGNAWILWRKQESSGPPRIMGKRHQNRVWQEQPERIDSEKAQVKECVMGCAEGAQPGVLLVQQSAQGDAVVFRTWAEQLGPVVPIGLGTHGPISELRLVMSPKGAVALWRQGEGKGAGLVVAKGL